jgi:hypothetical protein
MSEFRFRLILGKFPVVRVNDTSFVLKLGGTTEATIGKPPHADIRLGDILTLYTEVPLMQPKGTA